MLLGGDELARTQSGNNNAYCQDNELSWFDWELGGPSERLLAFARRLLELRRAHPVFRRTRFLAGAETLGSGLPDVWWFRPDGRRMTQRDWRSPDARTLGVFLNGREIGTRTATGAVVEDDSFLLLLNAGGEPVEFRLPPRRFGRRWALELSTAEPERQGGESLPARAAVELESHSLLLLRGE
jgi:glycogen operon protein